MWQINLASDLWIFQVLENKLKCLSKIQIVSIEQINWISGFKDSSQNQLQHKQSRITNSIEHWQ